MNKEEMRMALIEKLSEHGKVEVCSLKAVLTIFLKAKHREHDMTHHRVFTGVLESLKVTGAEDLYPTALVLKNEKDYFIAVMAPASEAEKIEG